MSIFTSLKPGLIINNATDRKITKNNTVNSYLFKYEQVYSYLLLTKSSKINITANFNAYFVWNNDTFYLSKQFLYFL